MKTLFATAALAAAFAMTAAPMHAQGKGNGNKAKKNSPLVGTYISRFTTDTVGFPGTPDFPCPALLGNPATPFVTSCSSALVVAYHSDGTITQGSVPFQVQNTDADDDLGETEMILVSSPIGNWTSITRSTFQTRIVNVIYNSDTSVNGFRVTDSRAQANSDFSSFSGTFESRTYFANQDPLDVNEEPSTRSAGTFETQRIE